MSKPGYNPSEFSHNELARRMEPVKPFEVTVLENQSRITGTFDIGDQEQQLTDDNRIDTITLNLN